MLTFTAEAGVEAYRETAAILVESYRQGDRSYGLINSWSGIHSSSNDNLTMGEGDHRDWRQSESMEKRKSWVGE